MLFFTLQEAGLRTYRRLWRKRYGKRGSRCGKRGSPVYHLGDNPSVRPTWTTQSGAMPTLRTSMGPLWHDGKKKRLSLKQLSTAVSSAYHESACCRLPSLLASKPFVCIGHGVAAQGTASPDTIDRTAGKLYAFHVGVDLK